MRERPILFSGPMVRALLAGTKTQTRRVVKPAPPANTVAMGRWQDPGPEPAYWAFLRDGTADQDHPFGGTELHGEPWRCPYGQPGDRLWVRETFYCDNAFYPDGVGVNCRWREEDGKRVAIPIDEQRAEMLTEDMYYRADGDPEFEGAEGPTPWRPSIHMPRWASRILLEVTDVRVEHLQDISEADAVAEGVEPVATHNRPGAIATHCGAYELLWEQINGPGSWGANPWVWCVSFKRIDAAISKLRARVG